MSLACIVLMVSMGHAQEQEQEQAKPLMGSEATPDAAAPAVGDASTFGGADGIFRILVVGDALAGGLGNGMGRMAQDDPRYEILNRFNESSGLARVEVYDWPTAIAKIVADKPVDAIVVLIGVNDRQDVRDGNTRYGFKAPAWVTGYTAQIDRMLDAAKSANATIYWVSIPPMADPGFDADMKFLSDLHRQRVEAKGGQFIDVRPFFLAPDGSYIDRGPDDTGVDRKLRSRDGVTFFKQGNNRFGQLVLGAIKTLDAATPTVAAAPSVPVQSSVAALELPQGVPVVTQAPMFGQEGLDGEQLTFRADAVPAVAAPALSVAQRNVAPASGGTPAIHLVAKAGSASERFLRDGIVSAAPAGRFDDYAEPPAAPAP